MDNKIEGRSLEGAMKAQERLLQGAREVAVFAGRARLKMSGVSLEQDPGFRRKSRCERADDEKTVVFTHNARLSCALLEHCVAVDAATVVSVVRHRALQLIPDGKGHDRQGDQLRVRMLDGRARFAALIFENQNILNSRIVFQR